MNVSFAQDTRSSVSRVGAIVLFGIVVVLLAWAAVMPMCGCNGVKEKSRPDGQTAPAPTESS